jgi:hypothetical protein
MRTFHVAINPGSAVAFTCRDGTEEMSKRGGAAAQQRGGEGDQRALVRERVAHRALREGAMEGRARGAKGRGRARQGTRLWILVFRPVSVSFTGLHPTCFNRAQP